MTIETGLFSVENLLSMKQTSLGKSALQCCGGLYIHCFLVALFINTGTSLKVLLNVLILANETICIDGKVWSSCLSSCTKTCRTRNEVCPVTTLSCVSGCECPPGFIESANGTCVNETLCPCYHNGKEYGQGEKISKDCNTWFVL